MTDDDQDEHDRPAVIIGSGFSRAVASAMPTMPGLAQLVLADLNVDPEVLAPFGGDLEQWMSYLSIDQPWLTAADNYENRGAFERVSDSIYRCITSAEASVIERPMPVWLQRLAWTWCDQQADVFTFNYDTLLERAVGGVNRLTTLGDVYVANVGARYIAGDGAGMFALGAPRGPLLSLYKLHGSTSWAFGGLDGPPNDRIVLWQPSLRWFPEVPPEEPPPPRQSRYYDDLRPLIIPPTLTKGPFFTNLTLRAQWRRAAEALRAAPRLTVIGYSFPPADLIARQWVGTSFTGDRMDVIDKEAKRPADVRAVLANPRDGDDLTGDAAIRDFVDRECGDLVAWRIAVEGSEGLLRTTIEVNGDPFLDVLGPDQSPWGTNSVDDARAWIHPRIEAAGGGNDVDRALGAMSGAYEDRQVVFRPGRHFAV